MTGESAPGRRLSELAFALLPQAIALVGSGGRLLYTSPSFDAIFPSLASPAAASDDDVLRAILSAGSTGDPIRFEREGSIWRARPHRTHEIGEEVTLWVVDDVTAEASAVKSRDEYLSMIVHDLRGPLAGIRGTLDFLLEDPEISLPEMHRDLFREARDEGSRMMNLINEILDFAKIRAGRFQTGVERVNTAILVRRSVLGVRSLAGREKIAVESDVPRNLPAIIGSTDKLLQVLNNLLVNAFKFTPAGGVVVVSAESRTSADGKPRVLLAVTDTGPGIPIDKQDELFSKFAEVGSSTDKDIAGTGLGLFITKAIVEAFSGSISFASVPGVGTSFLVDLPAWAPSERATGEIPLPLA